MSDSIPRLLESIHAGFQEALDELILSPNELVAAAGAVALDAYTHKVFGKVMLALMLGSTIKDLYDATAEPINLYERTRRYVKDMTVLFFTAMAEQYLEKVTEKVITKLSDTKFVRGFMDFVMEEDLLTGISDRILLARMYFAESDAEVFGKLSKYLEEDALTYLNAEIGKTGLKPRDVAKTLLKCARKNDNTKIGLDDARFVLRELRLGTEESVVVSLFAGGSNVGYKIINTFSADYINLIFEETMGYEPPYKPGTNVTVIQLTENKTYVRVYDKINSKMQGGWIMRAQDIAGLTPQEIQNKFALPNTPKYICDVNLEAGTLLRTGEVNPLFGFDGGGQQYDLIINGKNIGTFTNERIIR